MDLKEWLSSSGIPFENTAWISAPAYPYGVFLDTSNNRGADYLICISDHETTIEVYAEFVDQKLLEPLEALFKLQALEYQFLGWNWIESEKHYQASYLISYTEKF